MQLPLYSSAEIIFWETTATCNTTIGVGISLQIYSGMSTVVTDNSDMPTAAVQESAILSLWIKKDMPVYNEKLLVR
jgi:hypothetical protein